MFGTLRFFLATLVALSHAGVTLMGKYHLGVPAVVVFYILSGFVVTGMVHSWADAIQRAASGSVSRVNWTTRPPSWRRFARRFWAERVVRLYPPYAIALLLGLVAWSAGVASGFLSKDTWWGQWVANITVLPLAFAPFVSSLNGLQLVPPAWSLGVEGMFYLLAPWLVLSPRALWGAALLSLVWQMAVHGAAPWLGQWSDALGYRLFPAALLYFVMGAAVWLAFARDRRWWALPLLGFVAQSALLIVDGVRGLWGQPFLLETSLGAVVGAPLVVALAQIPRRRWDARLGQLSYPIFLSHFPVLWLLGWEGKSLSLAMLLGYLALVLALAWVIDATAQQPLRSVRQQLLRTPSA